MATIAIIDDDRFYRSLVAQVVRKCGHEPLEAPDGPQGLALVRAVRPALVLVDLEMPGMDGIAFLQLLRMDGRIASTPVLLMSAAQSIELIKRLGALDPQGIVVKSSSATKDIAERIARILPLDGAVASESLRSAS